MVPQVPPASAPTRSFPAGRASLRLAAVNKSGRTVDAYQQQSD